MFKMIKDLHIKIYRKLKKKFGKYFIYENIKKDSAIFWKSSFYDSRVKNLSHWRGVGDWNDQRWFAFGDFYKELISRYMSIVNEDSVSLAKKSALEWGPGGGVNVRILCELFEQVHGVDISEANLKECQRQIESLGYDNFQAHLIINQNNLSLDIEFEDETKVDFILCVAVFQHMPSKEYVISTLKKMNSIMSDSAHALFQIRYHDSSKDYGPKDSDYENNVITFMSFTREEFISMLTDTGYEVIEVEKDIDIDKANYEFYFVKKVVE